MEERLHMKGNLGKKADRPVIYLLFILVLFIPLQFFAIEMHRSGLLTDSWRSITRFYEDRHESETTELNRTQTECLKRVVNEDTYKDTNSNEIETLKERIEMLGNRLKQTVQMMKLKDLKESGLSHNGPTWFMSSLPENKREGGPEEFRFPSEFSKGRLLCLQGNHTTNGTMNSYGFAWKDYLPEGAIYLPGLTFVSDNYWDYVNPWHSMSALVPFAAWRAANGCSVPNRIILYHWGEVVPKMGDWISNILHATLGTRLQPETMNYGGHPVCFEDALVNRRGLGSMSRKRMNELFDIVRCKVNKFCGVTAKSFFSNNKEGRLDITILARSGAREFNNLTGVVNTVTEQCNLVKGCKVQVVQISDLSFCEQAEVMSRTDVLLTSHGAQITNAMLMPKGGSIMELFPKGWLEYAGIGQYIYSWLADWTELNHEGTWRDPDGPDCPYPTTETLKCFLFFKDRTIGLNTTHLSSWTRDVLHRVQQRNTLNNTRKL